MSVAPNKYLFMITSQGNVGYYSRDYIDQAVNFITGTVKMNVNIAIGFDGDGTGIREAIEPQSIRGELAKKVPTPSSTALLIVLRLINLGYTNVMLAQCQVAGYCGLAEDYNRIYCGGKEIILELYKNLYVDEVESKKIKLVDVGNPDDQLFISTQTGQTGQDEVQLQFVTIGYNGSNDAHYENVTVDYGIGGKVSDKLLVTLPSVFEAETFTVDVEVKAKNGKRVDLYGGTSHVASDLSGVGEPAGSTAGWLKSKFLEKFEKKYLIVFWDNARVNKGDNTFEMSICSRTIDVGLKGGNRGNGEKGFGLDGNNEIITIGSDDSDKFISYMPSVTRAGTVRSGGSRRKSKKGGRLTKGTRKTRKLRR